MVLRIGRRFAGVAVLLSMVWAALVIAAPASASVSSERYLTYTSGGQSAGYHVYADGIDWSRPVGVVYYLGGDYQQQTANYSAFHTPNSAEMTAMAQDANSRNMVFVPVETPDKSRHQGYYTWWHNGSANEKWFTSFTQWFQGHAGIDRNNVWVMGYSGGAEFIAADLFTSDQSAWLRDGGAVMIASGGLHPQSQKNPHPAQSHIAMFWYVGSQDGNGSTWPATWSALEASQQGKQTYQNAGYTNITRTVLPGVDHRDYRIDQLLKTCLDAVGVTMPGPGASARSVQAPSAQQPVHTPQAAAAPMSSPTTQNSSSAADSATGSSISSDTSTSSATPDASDEDAPSTAAADQAEATQDDATPDSADETADSTDEASASPDEASPTPADEESSSAAAAETTETEATESSTASGADEGAGAGAAGADDSEVVSSEGLGFLAETGTSVKVIIIGIGMTATGVGGIALLIARRRLA